MPLSPKLEKAVRTQLAIGTILMLISIVWLFVVLYLLKPDQIIATNQDVREAWVALNGVTSIPYSQWTLNTLGLLIAKASSLILLDVLSVVARYGGITLLFLGGYAVFEAVSDLRKAGRLGKKTRP